MRGELTQQLETIVTPVIEELAAELVELTVSRRRNTVSVNILADKPGGITVDECAFINKQVVRAIEQGHWCGDDFTVEVSSPGLDRILKTAKDFTRILNKAVRIHLKEPVEGKLEHHGSITKVSDDFIVITAKDKTMTVPLANIAKAVQKID